MQNARPVILKPNSDCLQKAKESCPMDVFEKDKDGNIIVKYPDRCIACYNCEMVCDDIVLKQR